MAEFDIDFGSDGTVMSVGERAAVHSTIAATRGESSRHDLRGAAQSSYARSVLD